MSRTLIVTVLALCAVGALAAPLAASEPVLTTGTASAWGVSRPIRELIRELPQPVPGVATEIPVQARPGTFDKQDPGVEPSGPIQTGPNDTLTPAVGLSFEGQSDDDNAAIVGFRIVPPDTNGDIGFDDAGDRVYVQWINLIVEVYDADTGASLAGPFPGNIFWAGFPGSCATQNDGDPVVLYDDDAGRWAMSQFDVGSGLMCWAISQTSDPLGAYNQYSFQVASAAGGNPDYPKAGVWAQAGVVGAGGGSNQSAYTQTTRNFPFNPASFMQLVAYERDVMLSGGPAPGFVQFGFSCVTGNCLEGALPPHQAGPPPPLGTCPTYSAIVDGAFDDTPTGDGVRLFRLCPNWGGAPTITETFAAAGVNIDRFLGNGFSDCISPIPGGGEPLDCLAIFTMFRAQYRWFGSEASMVLNTTVDAGGERAGIYWNELRSSDGETGWSIFQDGVYAPNDGAERWMGSIAQDGDRNIALGFSMTDTDPAILPSVHYTARQVGDPLGTMGNEEICHTGTGVQTASANRWGDYSSMSVDPSDDCTFWYTQEYYETSGSFDFTTRVCSFKFDDCGGGGGIPCDDIRRFQARCRPSGAGGRVQYRVFFTDGSHDGETVTFQIDGANDDVVTIVGNKAQSQQNGFASGNHDVSLVDPAGCVTPITVTCP